MCLYIYYSTCRRRYTLICMDTSTFTAVEATFNNVRKFRQEEAPHTRSHGDGSCDSSIQGKKMSKRASHGIKEAHRNLQVSSCRYKIHVVVITYFAKDRELSAIQSIQREVWSIFIRTRKALQYSSPLIVLLVSLCYFSRPPPDDVDEKVAQQPPRKKVAITKDQSTDPGCRKEEKGASEGNKGYAHIILISCCCFFAPMKTRSYDVFIIQSR